jgi:multiple sugar transport system substrate-binding protein
MKQKKLSRRDFLRMSALTTASVALAGCAPQVVKETVEVEVTREVEVPVEVKVPVAETELVEVEVTPTTAPPVAPGPAKLVYWTILGNVDGIIMDELVQEFMAENPEIEIESLQGVDDFEAKLQAAVLTGTGPDITLFRLHYIGPYASRNIILPLDAAQMGAEGVTGENFDPRVWDATFYQGKQFAIPFDIHLFCLFYSMRLFGEGGLDPEQPPETLTDWYEMARTLNQGDVIGTSIYSWPPGMFWIWYGLIKQWGGELFLDEGTRVDLTTPAHVEPTQWWHDLRWDINPDALNGDLTRTGQVAIWLDGPWTLSLWSDPERSQIVDDYAIARMPQHDLANPVLWANSHCFALPRPGELDQNKMAAAIRLMKWLSEHSFAWSARAGQIPASNIVRNSDEWQTGTGKILEGSRQFAETSLDYTVFYPQHPMMLEVGDRIAAALDAAINTQDTTPEEALQAATEEVNQILGQV